MKDLFDRTSRYIATLVNVLQAKFVRINHPAKTSVKYYWKWTIFITSKSVALYVYLKQRKKESWSYFSFLCISFPLPRTMAIVYHLLVEGIHTLLNCYYGKNVFEKYLLTFILSPKSIFGSIVIFITAWVLLYLKEWILKFPRYFVLKLTASPLSNLTR